MAIQAYARSAPGRPAVSMISCEQSLTFGALDDESARLATALRHRGLGVGDRLAILLENSVDYFVAAWAARRAGLRFVPVNWHLTAGEVSYVLSNSDSKAVVTSAALLPLTEQARPRVCLIARSDTSAALPQEVEDLDTVVAASAPLSEVESQEGSFMPYSSGTSGRPKGILLPLCGERFGGLIPFERLVASRYGFDADTVYLCPAPLYHTAPLGWSMAAQALGGHVVLMDRFEPEACLAAIERFRITHAQFVPTHFVRMLRLPASVRSKYDLSSLRVAIHSAAPCPVQVKEQMIAWWGPIIHEYYGASEGAGFVGLDSIEWQSHRGSVGSARSLTGHVSGSTHETPIRIVDQNTGAVLGPHEIGTIYFTNAPRFEYHKDPRQTAEVFNAAGWGTIGDVGYLDAEGYLYLTDRRSHMIISGGVNIYPQEVEGVLAVHPAVADVAVIGVPNEEFGEEVKAVIQLAVDDHTSLRDDLMTYCRSQLAGYKCPRSIEFVKELPRMPNGKLLKRRLREQYWS